MTSLETLEIETGPKPQASVIWMHGLGADGHDFAAVVPQLVLPAIALRFVFPHALTMPVTINGGYVMRAWYDIAHPDLLERQDETGIRNSQQQIEQLIAKENTRGIRSEKIVLAGFSQGGAMALHTGLRQREKLAGIMALSCYLPLSTSLKAEMQSGNSVIPIFMAHGVVDPIVPFVTGLRSRDILLSHGYQVEWHEYWMPHSVCPDEIADIGKWLKKVLGSV